MKRVVLSFAILLCAACGGAEGGEDVDGTGAKPGKPRPGKPGQDAGASVDAGAASDAGTMLGDGGARDTGPLRPDASAADGASASTFEGRWSVTLVANDDTTCTNPTSYESQILDTWLFAGDLLTGDHLGPNPYAREAGADVWNTGEATIVATADLELDGAKGLRGVFVFYRDTCDVFYDVTGIRAP